MSGRAPRFHAMTGEQQIAHTLNVARPPLPPHGAAAPVRDDEPPIQPLDDQLPDEDLSLARIWMPNFEKEFDTEGRTRRREKVFKDMESVWTAEEHAELEREIEERSSHVNEQMNPMTSKNWNYVVHAWGMFLSKHAKHIDKRNIWHATHIAQNFKAFLRWKVIGTEGQSESKRMSRKTLKCFANIFVQLIIKFAHDDSMKLVGLHLLGHLRLYRKIEDRVRELVKQYKLPRGYVRERSYISLPEVRILIEECLKLSTENGRASRIKLIVIILLTFFFLFRPSTLGPAHPDYEEQGLYPTLADILRIVQVGPCKWIITIKMSNYKGYNQDGALEMEYTITSVRLCQNALFDPCMWFLLYLVTRNALVGIDTVEDLIANKNAELFIKPEMKKEPLFLASAKGRKNPHEKRPMNSHAMQEAFRDIVTSAGINHATLTSLRRMGSTEVSIVHDKDKASFALTHSQRNANSFLRHYFLGMSAIDLVNARLLEYFTDGHSEENVRERMHALDYTRAAAINMLCRAKYDEYVQQGSVNTQSLRSQAKGSMPVKRTDEAEQAIHELDELREHQEEAARQWADLKGRYNVTACNNDVLPENPPDGNGIRGIKQRKGIIIDGSPEYLRLEVQYLKHFKKKVARLRHHRRVADESTRRDLLAGFNNNPTDSIEHRQQVADQIRNPPPDRFVLHAVRDDRASRNDGVDEAGPSRDDIAGPSRPSSSTRPSTSQPFLTSSRATTDVPAWEFGAEYAPPPTDEEFAEFAETMKFDELRKQLRHIDLEETISKCDRDIDDGDDDDDDDDNNTTLPQTSRPLERETDREELEGVDLPYLIACILRYAAKPFHDEQLVTRFCESQGGQFKCPTCAKLPVELRRDKTRDRAFVDRGKLNRHLKEVHSRWMDLVLEMITEDPKIFVCPSGDFKGTSVSAIREHCLSEKCVDRATYLELVEEAGFKPENVRPSVGSAYKLDPQASEAIHLSGDRIDDELDSYIPQFGSADSEFFKDISAADAVFEDIPNFVYRGSEAGLVDTTNDEDMEAFWAAHPDRYKVMTTQDLTDGSLSTQDVLNELERTGKRASTLAGQCVEELLSALAEV